MAFYGQLVYKSSVYQKKVLLLSLVNCLLSFLRCKVCQICLCFNITEMQKAVNVTFGLFLLPPCANSWPKRLFYAIYLSHSMRISGLCTQMLGFLTRFYAFFSDPRSLRINCYVFMHVAISKPFFCNSCPKLQCNSLNTVNLLVFKSCQLGLGTQAFRHQHQDDAQCSYSLPVLHGNLLSQLHDYVWTKPSWGELLL